MAINGSIGMDTPPSEAGGQASLISEGTGIPIYDAPDGIKSIKEVSGVEVSALTGLDAGTIGLRNRLAYFFVDEFGAIGDGVTDDTVAIQAAFTAAGAQPTGGVVFFPRGTFLVTGTITFPNVSCIVAQGSGGYGLGVSRITVKNNDITLFHILGDGGAVFDLSLESDNASATGDGVLCNGRDFIMQRCLVLGFFNGIRCTLNTASAINNCGISGQLNTGIFLSNSDSADQGDAMISDCVIQCTVGNQFAGLYQEGSGGTKVVNCKFLGAAPFQYGIRFVLLDGMKTSDLAICNNSIENYGKAAISVECQGNSDMSQISLIGGNLSAILSGANASGIEILNNGTGGGIADVQIMGFSILSNLIGIQIKDVVNVIIDSISFEANTTDVSRTASSLKTGILGDIATVPPVNPTVPAGYVDAIIYGPAGAVPGKFAYFQ